MGVTSISEEGGVREGCPAQTPALPAGISNMPMVKIGTGAGLLPRPRRPTAFWLQIDYLPTRGRKIFRRPTFTVLLCVTLGVLLLLAVVLTGRTVSTTALLLTWATMTISPLLLAGIVPIFQVIVPVVLPSQPPAVESSLTRVRPWGRTVVIVTSAASVWPLLI